MNADVKEQFSRIQSSALDRDVPLTDTLRLCIALGGSLGSPELIAWAEAELNGYTPDDELPAYRKLRAALKMSYLNGYNRVTGQEVTGEFLDDWFRPRMNDVSLRDPISALEDTLANAQGHGLTLSATNALSSMIYHNVPDNEFLSVDSVWWDVPRPAIASVLDRVRTRLVSMVAKFDAEVSKVGVSPTAAAQQAITIVAGQGSTVNLTNSGSGDAAASSGSSTTATSSGSSTTATSSDSSTTETSQGPDASSGGWWNWWKTGALIVATLLALGFAYMAVPGVREFFSN